MTIEEFSENMEKMLHNVQTLLLQKNRSFRETNTYYVDSYDEFKEKIEKGFVFAHWDGTAETAERIQEETKATIRCIPND